MLFFILCSIACIAILIFADSIINAALFVLQVFLTKKLKPIPGPRWSWPWFGHSHIIRKRGGLCKATLSLSREYKSDIVGLIIGGSYSVTACTHQTVKEVLSRPEFLGRPQNYFAYLRSMKTNKGVTMTDGRLWQEQRAFLIKHLSEVGFGRDLMNKMIEDSLKSVLKSIGEGGTDVDLSAILSKSVINVLWKIVTGEEILEEKLTTLIRLMSDRSKAFDTAGGWLSQIPWIRHIFPEWSGYNLILRMNEQLKTIITDTINNHKATYKEGVTRDFIDAFLHKMNDTHSKETSFTDDQLMMVCLDLFIGGIMTTSTSLNFCFLRMVHHPDVQGKAHAELDSVLGNKQPTADDRKRLPYLRAIINESLRMTMLVPVAGPRRTLRSTELGGYIIPKNATVFMNMYPISMDEQKFPEPELFKPERFMDVNGNVEDDANVAQTYAFGFGKRRCPGEVLARNFMFVVLSGILHQYNLGPPYRKPMPTLEPNIGIIHTPKPFKLSLTKRLRIRSMLH